MSDRLRIALVQLEITDGDGPANLARAQGVLRNAPAADLYLLPELWTSGYAHATWDRQAQVFTARVLDALAALARERGAWIGGSLITPSGTRLANRFWLLPPDGSEPVTYDKAHLFAPMGEPGRLEAGVERVRASVGGWTAALSLCYDLRFPEMYRLDALDGATLFLVPAEWPAVRAETLRVLARARAIENQAYVALCNRVGRAADGTMFGGGSAVIAPDGTVVAEAGATATVVLATLDAAAVAAARAQLPVFADRVPGVDTAPAEVT
jgi:predicted amidohydrolase